MTPLYALLLEGPVLAEPRPPANVSWLRGAGAP